ncbi:hypothetical protein HY483_01945 [Candidatus Woesearchaeota archaeon]|nr:hypothetical protein [Candidatus Woesearchaeota archaeon]
MIIREVLDSVSSSLERFNEKKNFDLTLSLLKELFSSFWAYNNLITPNVYNLVQQIDEFIFKVQRNRIKFDELSKDESLKIQRKIWLLLGFFVRFLKENPQIADLEIIQERDLKSSLKSFKILVVCVANAGRSPVLEQSIGFISENVGLKIVVKSCGIFNLINSSQKARAKQPLLSKLIGRDVDGVGVPVSADLCDWANIVLTAAPYVTERIVGAFPSSKSKVITAKEFVARYKISDQGFSYAFYIDEPTFSTQREKALDEWLSARRGSVKDFMQAIEKDIAEGRQKAFLYKNKYPEGENSRGEFLSINELLKLSFAIIERLIQDNYLTTRPEVSSLLLFKLNELRKRVL